MDAHLSLVNVVQAVGSMLWYEGLHEQHIGQSGIWYCALIRVVAYYWLPHTAWSQLPQSFTRPLMCQ